MRKKITSLNLLLLSGALVLTSCVKNEEEENTKALRTAQEQRAKEKLAEEKDAKTVELEKARVELEASKLTNEKAKEELEKTKVDNKKALVEHFVNRKTALLGEIAAEKANIVTAQNENADRATNAATLQSKVDLAAEKLARDLESYDRKIAAKEHEKTVVEAANLADVVELNKQVQVKNYEKTVAEQQKEVADQAYKAKKAEVVKAFTDAVLGTDFAKALYSNDGNGRYTTVSNPNVAPYVKNFTNTATLNNTGKTIPALAGRNIDFIAVDNDATKPVSGGYTFTEVTARKQVSLQNLNYLQAEIIANTQPRPDYSALDTAIADAQTAVNNARTAYNTDPSTANRDALAAATRNLQTAQNNKTNAQAAYTRASETATKLRAAQAALTTDGNLAAVNSAIDTFNGALATLAEKNAAVKTQEDKVSLLEAEIDALVALGGSETGDISAAKAERLKALNNAITDLKELKRAAEEAHANVVKTNITDKTRATAAKEAVIAASEAVIAAKTAELNYVNAQLTALGIQ